MRLSVERINVKSLKVKMLISGIGLDLSPHYYLNLKSHPRPESLHGLGSPGKGQGLNTGVVLYQLDRMRRSGEYNKLLKLDYVAALQQKYNYSLVSSLSLSDFTHSP